MKNHPFADTGINYTASHEWIRFTGQFAYVGISKFKTSPAKKIKKISLVKIYGYKNRGEVFACVQMDFQLVEVHMPVGGSIVQVNDLDRLISENLLLTQAETEAWLVKISLRAPIAVNELLSREQYYHQYLPAKPDKLNANKSQPSCDGQSMVYGRRTI